MSEENKEEDENDVKNDTGDKEYYVDYKVFTQQISDFYESGDSTPDDELVENLQKIAQGLSFNWRFIRYTSSWKEDMVGDAIIKMYSALIKKQFKLESGKNPFSYFNTIAWNAFSNRIKKEKRQHSGLLEYRQQVHDEFLSDPNNQFYAKPIQEGGEEDFYED